MFNIVTDYSFVNPTVNYFLSALADRGIRAVRAGDSWRLPAWWRDSSDRNISLFPSGAAHDHARGEVRSVGDLAGKLGIQIPRGLNSPSHSPFPAPSSTPASSSKPENKLKSSAVYISRLVKGSVSLIQNHPAAKAARSYLAQRGLDVGALNLEGVGAMNIRAAKSDAPGADYMLIIVCRALNDVAPGEAIQRIYISASGEPVAVKSDHNDDGARKKALGSFQYGTNKYSRVAILARPAVATHVFVCEGPETGLALSILHPGAIVICAISANGIKSLDWGQLRQFRLPVVLCGDNDKLNQRGLRTGQDAVCLAAEQGLAAGIPIGIALPENKDWLDDWNFDFRRAENKLRDIHWITKENISCLRQRINAGTRLPREHKALSPLGMPVAKQSVTEAREELQAALENITGGALLEVPTGTGKTRALAEHAARAAEPSTILVNNHQLANEVREVVAEFAAPDSFQKYYGRSDKAGPGQCLRFENIEDLTCKARSAAVHECRSCPHGAKAMLQICRDEPYPTVQMLESLRRAEAALSKWASGNGAKTTEARAKMIVDLQPCEWLKNASTARKADILIHTKAHADLDHSGDYWKCNGSQRLVMIDETGDPVISTTVGFDDLVAAANRVRRLVFEAEAKQKDERYSFERGAQRQNSADRFGINEFIETRGYFLAKALDALADEVKPFHGQREHKPIVFSTRSPVIADLFEILRHAPTVGDGRIAEVIDFGHGGVRTDVPKRWCSDFLSAARDEGIIQIVGGALRISTITRSFKAFTLGRAIAADATPGYTWKRVAEAKGIPIHKIAVDDPATIHLIRGTGFTLSALSRGRAAAIRKMIEAIERLLEDNNTVGVLTHKTAAETLIKWARNNGLADRVEIGWWGRDERGTNRFEHIDAMAIFGISKPSPMNYEARYNETRATLNWATKGLDSAQDLPPFDSRYGDIKSEFWITGHCIAEGPARGYLDPEIQAFACAENTARVAQVIGRTRSVARQESVPVFIFTNEPLDLAIDSLKDSETWFERAKSSRSTEAMARIEDAVRVLEDGGKSLSKITYDEIAAEVQLKTGCCPSRHTIKKWLSQAAVQQQHLDKACEVIEEAWQYLDIDDPIESLARGIPDDPDRPGVFEGLHFVCMLARAHGYSELLDADARLLLCEADPPDPP